MHSLDLKEAQGVVVVEHTYVRYSAGDYDIVQATHIVKIVNVKEIEILSNLEIADAIHDLGPNPSHCRAHQFHRFSRQWHTSGVFEWRIGPSTSR